MTHFNLYHFSKTTKPTLTVVTGISHDLNIIILQWGPLLEGFLQLLSLEEYTGQ